jgi:hypothetical protein
MTLGEWLLADHRRSVSDPAYNVGLGYVVTARDGSKYYRSVGDTEAEAWDGMLDQLGVKPGRTP